VAAELLLRDTDTQTDEKLLATEDRIRHGERIRIVFSENSAFEPVISNVVLTFGEPVNILKASTKNVGGVAKGEMILEFKNNSRQKEQMKTYFEEHGLAIEEVMIDGMDS
jgi:D-methionine transport system ATP-binding protein